MSELVQLEPVNAGVTRIAPETADPSVGDWYWISPEKGDDDKASWLGCITHRGSNYFLLTGVDKSYERIHVNEFELRCTHEPNYRKYIDGKTAECKRELDRLTREIKELTTGLGLNHVSLAEGGSSSDISVLAVSSGNGAIKEYQSALVVAQDKTLPALFQSIKKTSAELNMWLLATTIPLQTQADGFNQIIDSVKTRIFNVELYAGLTETVEQIADGNPAQIGEKVRLMQRRAYMDEECLAEYQHGGMDFDGICEFDRWLAKPENRDRILPFPRCVLAFQVRRNDKYRECVSISDFINVQIKKEEDRATFLYIRNGEQLFRLGTAIDFGPKLFPDFNAGFEESGAIYAETYWNRVDKDKIIPEREYVAMVEAEREAKRKEAAKLKGLSKKERWRQSSYISEEAHRYTKIDQDSVFLDDVEKCMKQAADEHNRLVVILQGLMDRSAVFHPHPNYSLWKEADFKAAFDLIYDDSRALTAGQKPDFEAFRVKLNETLKAGCITFGQDEAWELREGERESKRLDSDWRTKTHYRPTHFRPYGDPGPGRLATVESYSKKSGTCTYHWTRERRTYRRWADNDKALPCALTVPAKVVLNVTAYQPGMFKQFFADPRTRAEYLKWAPALLAAEEYHAGNLTGKPKKESDQ